ncbi:MAG TPA: hypothetical protein VJI97_03245 [Candidatus Nanoarchaeia archaeon]|nr:hypothetical protein [Candidatus Nanoarchaeia archaeon]
MQKRGQLVNKALIVLIVSAIIVIAFISAGKSFGSQEAYYKLAVAKDLALSVDIISGLPGDTSFTYPNDVSGYDIEVKKNSVTVYSNKLGKLDPIKAVYGFSNAGYPIDDTYIKNSKYILIEKTGSIIKITGTNDK